MRVLFATSEATPFIKSGGLADVLGSLPKEMAKKGVESIVVLPKYQDMKLADKIEYVTNFDIWVGSVSYTHLDVYKRQNCMFVMLKRLIIHMFLIAYLMNMC